MHTYTPFCKSFIGTIWGQERYQGIEVRSDGGILGRQIWVKHIKVYIGLNVPMKSITLYTNGNCFLSVKAKTRRKF